MAKEEKINSREEYDIAVRELAKARRKLLETNLELRCIRAGLRKSMKARIASRPSGSEEPANA